MLLLILGFRFYFYRHFVASGMGEFHRSNFHFAILLITIGLISSAGYLVNDIFDVETDKINKPNKKLPYSSDTRWIIYSFMNILAVIFTFLLSDNLTLKIILIGTIVLLYLYSSIFQKRILIGNFIVAFLSGTLPFTYLFFEGLSVDSDYNLVKISLIIFYAILAFSITLLREIVKDKEDEKGDQLAEYKTLANSISERSFKIVTNLYIVISIALVNLLINYLKLEIYQGNKIYFWVACSFLFISSLYYIFKSNYKKTSLILKLTLFLGVLFLYIL